MTGEYDGPRRAYRLVLDLEADTYDELLNALDQLGVKLSVERRNEGAEITSGGYASGYHVEITHQDKQTGDRYRKQLTEWCDARRKAPVAAGGSPE